MKKFLEVAADAARQAGAILRAEFDHPKEISYKGEIDIVTESDKRSEALIVGRLRSEFPDHAIVAEEGGTGAAAGARYCWQVDPLDGTTNFAHGYPCFAVSMGLLEYGEPVVATVLNPFSNELFTAIRGEGAFLNGKRIHVSPVEKLVGKPGVYRLSSQDAAKQREHESLLGIHVAFPRRAAGRVCGARPLLGRLRPLRGFLGIRLEFVGHCGGDAACNRSGRKSYRFRRPAVSSGRTRTPRVQWKHPLRNERCDRCGSRQLREAVAIPKLRATKCC